MNKYGNTNGNLATPFLYPVGEANPYVKFGYRSHKNLFHKQV